MRIAPFLAGAVLFVPTLLLAQAQGRIKGVVTNDKGEPIAGAKVILTCPDITNFRKELSTDKNGSFATLIIDATKQYLFHVEAAGYQAIEQMKKPLVAGQTLEADFVLTSLQQLEAQAQEKVLEEPGFKEVREARELLAAGKQDEARAKYEEAVKAKPDLYVAWLELGDLDQKAGRNDEALAAAEKCLAVKPDLAQCLALAMNASLAKGDKAAYAKYAELYKVANPSDPTVYYNDAVAYLNKGDDAKAKPLLEKALAADPKYAEAMFQLGMVYFRMGDTAKAKEMLQNFLEVAPDHKEAATAKEMLKYM